MIVLLDIVPLWASGILKLVFEGCLLCIMLKIILEELSGKTKSIERKEKKR